MRVFVSDLHGHVGRAVRLALAEGEHEIVGTINPGEESPGKVAEVAEVRFVPKRLFTGPHVLRAHRTPSSKPTVPRLSSLR